jgi:hypothetical protein
MTPNSRRPVYVLAAALVLVGVAVVAFAAGVASRGSNPAPVATVNPGPDGLGPQGFGPGWFGRGGFRVPAVRSVSGTVTSVSSGSVTIAQPNGVTRTLTLTGSTTYTQTGSPASQSALVVGARIVARVTVDSSGNLVATAVVIQPAIVQGTVAGKTATTIVVTTADGKTVTVNVSSSTKYVVRGVESPTLDSIAAGYTIQAQGTLNADGTLTATVVQAGPKVQPVRPGRGGGQATLTPSTSPTGSSI